MQNSGEPKKISKLRRIPVSVIRSHKSWSFPDLRDLWKFRHLLYTLAWRDIRVRYKQTVLGIWWAVLNPLVTMVVFSFVFGEFAKVPSDGFPYPIFSYVALLPWQYFSSATGKASTSLVSSAGLTSKVYFPRIIVIFSALFVPLFDFFISFLIVIGMMVFYGIKITPHIIALPFFMLLNILISLTVSLWMSSLHVRLRDVGFALPFILQIWMFLSPIAYPSSLVPARWRGLYNLNPIAVVVEGFRWSLLGKGYIEPFTLALSFFIIFALIMGGLLYFTRTEGTFVDLI